MERGRFLTLMGVALVGGFAIARAGVALGWGEGVTTAIAAVLVIALTVSGLIDRSRPGSRR